MLSGAMGPDARRMAHRFGIVHSARTDERLKRFSVAMREAARSRHCEEPLRRSNPVFAWFLTPDCFVAKRLLAMTRLWHRSCFASRQMLGEAAHEVHAAAHLVDFD